MKVYVEIPNRGPAMGSGPRKFKFDYLPLLVGITFSWVRCSFMNPNEPYIRPKGRKEGKHIFSIEFGCMYWWGRVVFYKPGKI